MSVERSAYLDTSALAKWYLNEAGSDAFVAYLQGPDLALITASPIGPRSLTPS